MYIFIKGDFLNVLEPNKWMRKHVASAGVEAWPCFPCDPDTTCLLLWLQGQSRFSGLTPGITFPGLNNQACAPVTLKMDQTEP